MRQLMCAMTIFFASSLSAQDISLFEKKEYQHEDGKVLPYRILYPENYDKSKKYPLILVLHGAGERGTDNESQLVHGSKLFADAENRKKFPAIVVFPQCPQTSFWAAIKVDTTQRPFAISFDYNTAPNWPLLAANNLVKELAAKEAVDNSRIYISGLSMGGMGTFESVYRNPGLYAAALPICGGGDEKSYAQWKGKTAFWVFHGDADPVVKVKLSQDMVAQLKKIGATVTYTEYPGVMHNSWDNAFAEPTYLSWMMQQKLP